MLKHNLYKNVSLRVDKDVEWVEEWYLDFYFFNIGLAKKYLKSDNTVVLQDGLFKKVVDKVKNLI